MPARGSVMNRGTEDKAVCLRRLFDSGVHSVFIDAFPLSGASATAHIQLRMGAAPIWKISESTPHSCRVFAISDSAGMDSHFVGASVN